MAENTHFHFLECVNISGHFSPLFRSKFIPRFKRRHKIYLNFSYLKITLYILCWSVNETAGNIEVHILI